MSETTHSWNNRLPSVDVSASKTDFYTVDIEDSLIVRHYAYIETWNATAERIFTRQIFSFTSVEY